MTLSVKKRMTATEQRGRPRANRAADWNRRPPAEIAAMGRGRPLERKLTHSPQLWIPPLSTPERADADFRAPGRMLELRDSRSAGNVVGCRRRTDVSLMDRRKRCWIRWVAIARRRRSWPFLGYSGCPLTFPPRMRAGRLGDMLPAEEIQRE